MKSQLKCLAHFCWSCIGVCTDKPGIRPGVAGSNVPISFQRCPCCATGRGNWKIDWPVNSRLYRTWCAHYALVALVPRFVRAISTQTDIEY